MRGEYTKTKTDRIVFLTNEMVTQLKTWLDRTNIDREGYVIMTKIKVKQLVNTVFLRRITRI